MAMDAIGIPSKMLYHLRVHYSTDRVIHWILYALQFYGVLRGEFTWIEVHRRLYFKEQCTVKCSTNDRSAFSVVYISLLDKQLGFLNIFVDVVWVKWNFFNIVTFTSNVKIFAEILTFLYMTTLGSYSFIHSTLKDMLCLSLFLRKQCVLWSRNGYNDFCLRLNQNSSTNSYTSTGLMRITNRLNSTLLSYYFIIICFWSVLTFVKHFCITLFVV